MDNQNTNTINIKDYLVTEIVDTGNIRKEQLLSDLEQLTKAEEKSTYKANIAKDIKNPQIKRAVSALRLSNPFKGY